VTSLNESTGKVLAWTTSEVGRGDTLGVGFYVGSPSAKTVVRQFHGPCAICGEDVLEIAPRSIEQQLPEYGLGGPGKPN